MLCRQSLSASIFEEYPLLLPYCQSENITQLLFTMAFGLFLLLVELQAIGFRVKCALDDTE